MPKVLICSLSSSLGTTAQAISAAVLDFDCNTNRSSSTKVLGLLRSSDTESIAPIRSEFANEMIAKCSAKRSAKVIFTSKHFRVSDHRVDYSGHCMRLLRQRRIWFFACISSFSKERIGIRIPDYACVCHLRIILPNADKPRVIHSAIREPSRGGNNTPYQRLHEACLAKDRSLLPWLVLVSLDDS